MKCALCHKDKVLQNSHIIPEFCFQPLYDTLHRFHELPSDPEGKECLRQKGYREPLLCMDCETKFSVYESYANEVLFIKTPDGEILGPGLSVIKNIEYRRFKLFLMSLLWRMGVSTLDIFSEVKLGPHEERLRMALLADDPLDKCRYPCFFSAVTIDGKFYQDFMLPPSRVKTGGHTVYRVTIAGLIYSFFVSNTKVPYEELLFSGAGNLYLFKEDARNIPFLRRHVFEVSSAMDIRKKKKNKLG